MDTSIDTLVIEIESSAKDTGGGIDSLISKLENLKVKVNENLKALGRLNSALIQLKSNSVGLGDFSKGSIDLPKITKTPSIDLDTTSVVEGTNKAKDAMSSMGNEATDTANKLNKLGTDSNDTAVKVDNISNRSNSASKNLNNMGKNADNTGNKLRFSANKGKNSFQELNSVLNRTKRVLSGVGSAISIIANPFGSLFSLIGGRGRASINDMGNAVSTLVKKLRMTTLALLGTRGAFTAIRKAVSEYMAYDTALAQTLQQDWAILGSLIAPILERIINLFSILVSYIATFIKMLTGVDLVAKANKKSLGGVGSSAGGTAKKVKELNKELGQLQKFDDLNVVDFPDNSGSSGGGGGGGGGGAGGISPLSLPEVDTSALDALFDFIKRGDWYGLGMEIARKFNEGISKIDFYSIEQKARQWGKNMGDLLNGITDGLDWGLLGQQIAGGLNTVMGFVNTFFDTYNFEHLGDGLAEGLNAMVETIHWDDLGKFLTNKIKALYETMLAFSQRFDWKKLGQGIGTTINSGFENIDFGKSAKAVSLSIQGIFTTATSTLETIDWEMIANKINDALSNLDLGDVGSKISDFILELFDDAITFLDTLDWNEFGKQVADLLGNIDWVGLLKKGLLGSAKLDKALKEIGKGFVFGLVDSITENLLGFKFTEVVNAIKTRFDEIKAKIKEWWESVKAWFAEKLALAIVWVGDKVTGIKDKVVAKFTEIKDGIKNRITEGINFIKEKFTWNNIKNTFETIKTNIATKFTNIRDDIKSKVDNAVSKLKNAFTWENIKTTFTNLISKIKSKFGEIGTNVGSIVSSKFNSIVSKIINKAVDVINGFIRAINKAVGAINKIPGVKIGKLNTIDYPKLATGTNEIEVEGLYHLHQGEAVVPKKYNPAINNKAYNENNEKMLRKMDDLLNVLNNMETTNIVNIGNERVHKSTVRYINRENNIYGINVV